MMTYAAFDTARLTHVAHAPKTGDAVTRIISPPTFDTAISEISGWRGYAPTPLINLTGLAQDLSLAAVFYKDEGPRFGLGSFKALGAAYAALRVLQREIGARLGRPVTFAEIRDGGLKHEAARITLASATDGNHPAVSTFMPRSAKAAPKPCALLGPMSSASTATMTHQWTCAAPKPRPMAGSWSRTRPGPATAIRHAM
jgi:hypothetical protein